MTMHSFESLSLPRKDGDGSKPCNYRIYKSAEEFIVVPASTALEALNSCGVEQVIKIERDMLSNSVLDPKSSAKVFLGEKPAAPEAQAAAPAADAPPAQEAASAETAPAS